MNIVAFVLVDQISMKEYEESKKKERHNKKIHNKKHRYLKKVDFKSQP